MSDGHIEPGTSQVALDHRLASIARLSGNGMILLDRTGRIDWVNDAFVARTGYTLDLARGQFPCDLLESPVTDPESLLRLRQAVFSGQDIRLEIQLQDRHGGRFWVDLDIRPTFDADGDTDGFISVQTEVTSAKLLEARLKAASASLRSASQLAQLGGWEVDSLNRQIHWSPEVQVLLGRPQASDPFEVWLTIFPEAERPKIRAAFGQSVQTGKRFEFETPVLTADGGMTWFRVVGEPELVEGRCVAIHGAMQDISAQRAAHADLLESERFGRGVIDGVAANLVVIDDTGAIVAANEAFLARGATLGRGEPDVVGRNFFRFMNHLPAGHGKILERGLRRILSGKSKTFVRTYEGYTGELYRMTAARFAGDGPVRCVVMTQSIQDLKRSEDRLRDMNASLKQARDDAEAANRAKSAFLATMSHEIRTPLNGVLGMAQAMARDDLPPAQRDRLTVIRQAGETLLTLLNDLLDLSRIEAGRMDLEDSSLDVLQLVQGAEATFTTLASEKDVGLTLQVSEDARGLWAGDPTRVRQILYNLVSNAVKFTGRGQVTVDISVADSHLVMSVADTGPGIAPDRLGHLFQKFVQEDASTTRRFGGSGLGLAICRELATLMGGTIGVSSVVGEGSTFTARLPLTRLGDAPEASDPEGACEAPELAEGAVLRILAAEDNPMNQLVLRTLMAQVGVEITCVDNGALAVAAAASGHWDAILMDVQMPVMDGPTAARQIRAAEAAAGRRRVPILALTANAMAHHEAEYTDAGMDALVPKPIQLERLLATLQAVLDQDEPAMSREVDAA